MKKKFSLFTALVLSMVMLVSAVPCAAAVEKTTIDPAVDKGSVTIIAKYNDRAVKGLEFTLYRVGTGETRDSNLYFNLQEQLLPEEGSEEEAIDLNGMNAAETEKATADLAKKIRKLSEEDRMARSAGVAETDEEGKAVFSDLPVGVYLALKTGGSSRYKVATVLLFLPYTNEEGTAWETDVVADPKISYRGGSGGGGDDPVPPEEIPEDPVPMDPADPPEPDPEVEVEDPDVPLAKLPQTGLLQWPIPVMTVTGLLLIAVGMMVERKKQTNRAK